MKEYEFHEAANIFPLDEEHLDELAEDIRQYGQQVAIEIMDNQILDGRRRYLACKKAGVNPRTIEVDAADPVAYVRSLNLYRRHLSGSQLATCAARAEKLIQKYAAEAEQRMKATLKRGSERPAPVNLPERGDSRDQVGKDFGVSGKYVDLGRKVLKTENPKLIKAVDDDLIAVSTAARAASLSRAEQDALVDRVTQKAAEGKSPRKRPAAERQEAAAEANGNGQIKLQGVGVFRAHEAINCMSRIPKNDGLRKEGFQLMRDWLKRNE